MAEKPPLITATTVYSYTQCPTRVEKDLFEDPKHRDAPNPFVEMLWERGTLYEEDIIRKGTLDFLDLSSAEGEEKERLTLEAMRRGEKLIYSGRIASDDLAGIPDLLRKHGNGYLPIDIKSGRGKEDSDDGGDGKPKLHYAVQIALYVDILERLGLSVGRRGFILDINGNEIEYDLDEPRLKTKPDTLWDEYQAQLANVRSIFSGRLSAAAALASPCKLCHWFTHCSSTIRSQDDLTLIPGLGRAKRDALVDEFATVADLAEANPEGYITGKKTPFFRIGPASLEKFHARAKLLTEPNAKPYLTAPVALPSSDVELFFDIEVDPLRDLTYLHGIVERRGSDNSSERFLAFFAETETEEAERDAFAQSVAFLTGDPKATIWYYSRYERTIYRKLQARYPDVCSPELIEDIFDPVRAVDLYSDVVAKATEWPTNDHSIKSLAKYLGFNWRDTNPSGAASIQWFDEWVKTRDPAVRQRILDYNEDDCRATRVLLDGIRALD